MFSVGQNSVKVGPKVSQITCSFDHSSVKCDCWHWFACCSVVKSAPQCLCLVWIDERSRVVTPQECAIQLFLHCFGCLLGVPWCFVYAPVICQCKNLAGSILVQICQTFGIDIEEDDESGKPCGRPIVNWWGAELQFSSCITAVLFRSAHAVH